MDNYLCVNWREYMLRNNIQLFSISASTTHSCTYSVSDAKELVLSWLLCCRGIVQIRYDQVVWSRKSVAFLLPFEKNSLWLGIIACGGFNSKLLNFSWYCQAFLHARFADSEMDAKRNLPLIPFPAYCQDTCTPKFKSKQFIVWCVSHPNSHVTSKYPERDLYNLTKIHLSDVESCLCQKISFYFFPLLRDLLLI